MSSNQPRSLAGAIALVGSGEYLDAMNEVDTYLLDTVGGATNARIALLPTASGLEANGPTYWNDLGLEHFQKLGVRDIRPTCILNHADASNPEQLTLLRGANFFYFSGGNPQHIIETMSGTPAWEIITTAYKNGAVLAGCSAGAMMLGGYTLSIRKVMAGADIEYVEALAIVPQIIVFPHFDRLSRFVDEDQFQRIVSAVPPNSIMLGIDEETALVHNPVDNPTRWRAMGRQTVKVYSKNAAPKTLRPGEELALGL